MPDFLYLCLRCAASGAESRCILSTAVRTEPGSALSRLLNGLLNRLRHRLSITLLNRLTVALLRLCVTTHRRLTVTLLRLCITSHLRLTVTLIHRCAALLHLLAKLHNAHACFVCIHKLHLVARCNA